MVLPIIILTNIKHNVTRCQGQIGNFVPVFCGAGNLVGRARCCNEVSAQKIPPSGDILREGVAQQPVVPHGVPVLIAAVDRHWRAVGHGGHNGAVAAAMPDGASVTVYGRYQDWYTVGYNGLLGYAFAEYIT